MGFADKLKKAASTLIASSYSVADKANSLAQQNNPGSNSSSDNLAYNDGSTYSPGNPLTPQNQGRNPWQYQFMVGQNLVITPRSEKGNLIPFDILRGVASNHDITALCIQMMIDQVTGDEWDIVSADKNDRDNHEKDIQTVKDFFSKPDKVHLFNDWLKPILFDALSCDAACIYKHRTYGGKLFSLEYVDGTTIKPLIDVYGRVPLPPYAAYQQIIYGYPYGSSSKKVTKQLGFTLDEISYRPRYPKTWTVYGTSPIEKILVKINIALRRDTSSLNFFTDGSMPDGGIYSFDKEDMTPDQIEQFSTLYNDIASGSLKDRFKLKFLPKGKYTPTKEHKFDVQYDEWLARIVAIAFGVNPQAFIMMMNRSTGQLQDQQQTDIGLGPLENYLAEWFTDIIQNDLGYKHLKFKYIDEKREDAKISVTRDVEFVKAGIITIDEVRSQRGLPPLTNLPDGVPAIIQVGNDVIPLTEDWFGAKTKAQLQALTVGDVQGGNQQNTELRIRQASEMSQNDQQQPPSMKDSKDTAQDKKDAQKAAQDELKQFEKFAVSRLKKKTKREFEPNILPLELVKTVSESLQKMDKPEQIKKLFRDLEEMKKQSDLISQSSDEINKVFEEFKQTLIENSNDITEEDFAEENSDSKKALFLLILLGDFDLEEKLLPVLENMLTNFAKQSLKEAISEIKELGGNNIASSKQKEIIDRIVENRISFILPEIVRVSEEKIGADTYTNTDKESLIQAISSAYAVSLERSENISEIEHRTIRNISRIEAAKESDAVYAVLVSDGQEFDGACIDADGQIWSLDYAGENVLQHPKCHREFTFLTEKQTKEMGGINVE